MHEERVKKLLDSIRPGIQMDGGDVEFVEIKDGIVYVRLIGACGGCPMAQLTLKDKWIVSYSVSGQWGNFKRN